jgi:hypothetical protein
MKNEIQVVEQYWELFRYIAEKHPKFFSIELPNKPYISKNYYKLHCKKHLVEFICENNLMYNNTEEIETLWKLQVGNID